MIIQPAGQYDSPFFSALPQHVKNVEKYFNSLKGLDVKLKAEFPELKLVILPTVSPKTAYIQGLLLPNYIIKELYLLPEQYTEYGLPIYAEISEDYQEVGIKVYDCRKRINWEQIPFHLRHCVPLVPNNENEERWRYICTHNKQFITPQNCIFGVLNSAYSLFREYQKLDAIKRFDLKCLPHSFSDKDVERIYYD